MATESEKPLWMAVADRHSVLAYISSPERPTGAGAVVHYQKFSSDVAVQVGGIIAEEAHKSVAFASFEDFFLAVALFAKRNAEIAVGAVPAPYPELACNVDTSAVSSLTFFFENTKDTGVFLVNLGDAHRAVEAYNRFSSDACFTCSQRAPSSYHMSAQTTRASVAHDREGYDLLVRLQHMPATERVFAQQVLNRTTSQEEGPEQPKKKPRTVKEEPEFD